MIFFFSDITDFAKSCVLLSVLILSESFSFAALEDITKEPINYNSAPVHDRVFRLIKKIENMLFINFWQHNFINIILNK